MSKYINADGRTKSIKEYIIASRPPGKDFSLARPKRTQSELEKNLYNKFAKTIQSIPVNDTAFANLAAGYRFKQAIELIAIQMKAILLKKAEMNPLPVDGAKLQNNKTGSVASRSHSNCGEFLFEFSEHFCAYLAEYCAIALLQ
ncbi:hypothetical protein T11_14329 [Trichinella zimbabwensis]|uniref:Uncharacterized protein n=1 Tax=Trichinella zimbabwensis TaxID=268475 RepID=A0A0V1I598_9BILA|nr:hypothetical protein T11_14329 [Trichinella zimbabwensis]